MPRLESPLRNAVGKGPHFSGRTVRHPVQIDEHELYVSTSIGISLFPEDGDESAQSSRTARLTHVAVHRIPTFS